MCGGTAHQVPPTGCRRGLSPRVRGNHLAAHLPDSAGRSIPACAGEPSTTAGRTAARAVYPRVCGGTGSSVAGKAAQKGLSPRVRGNRRHQPPAGVCVWSIPACAGEPLSPVAIWRAWWVYPRVCGGTAAGWSRRDLARGLSPRVRGNLTGLLVRVPKRRSIPACAGEPLSRDILKPTSLVYPRVCGGTGCVVRFRIAGIGLSPRVRGNLGLGLGVPFGGGSIPACAGEPRRFRGRRTGRRVYPRVCGGTMDKQAGINCVVGLSPRVRGNPLQPSPAPAGSRSIPACAGEPVDRSAFGYFVQVYPRVCGGTSSTRLAQPCSQGLSPRVRGNLASPLDDLTRQGSIPACAGEPARIDRNKPTSMVYPRVCGGTDSGQLLRR